MSDEFETIKQKESQEEVKEEAHTTANSGLKKLIIMKQHSLLLSVVKVFATCHDDAYHLEAWRISRVLFPLQNAAIADQWLTSVVTRLLTTPTTTTVLHPLAVLTATACPHFRSALSYYMLHHNPSSLSGLQAVAQSPFAAHISIASLLQSPICASRTEYFLKTSIEKYERNLLEAKPQMVKCIRARPHNVRGPFTMQIMQCVAGKTKKKTEFLIFLDAQEMLCFFVKWYALQLTSPPGKRITLHECGTHDGTLRKWVVDVDAKLPALQAAGFSTDPNVLFVLVLELAEAIGEAMHQMGCTCRPCPYAIVSRHSEKQCSWHITLCALAPLSRWREVLQTVLLLANDEKNEDEDEDSKLDETLLQPPPPPSSSSSSGGSSSHNRRKRWAMAKFIDAGTLRNGQSQYIQTWGSTKVDPSQPMKSCNCFKWEGVWANSKEPIQLPEV